jgi:hypothetical protein
MPSVQVKGDSRAVDIAVKDDFQGHCDQESSYKHAYNFEWLQRYDRLKLRIYIRITENIRNIVLTNTLCNKFNV